MKTGQEILSRVNSLPRELLLADLDILGVARGTYNQRHPAPAWIAACKRKEACQRAEIDRIAETLIRSVDDHGEALNAS
jgi:hypothetical protein